MEKVEAAVLRLEGVMDEETSRRARVFISYAREDSEIARRLYHDLKDAGAEPWLDAESLLPGQAWKTAISNAIRTADFFLALLSSSSVNKRGWVQKETKEALDVLETIPESGIYLIPARLDDCEPTHGKLSELNWVDLFPFYETGLRKLLLVIRPSKAVVSGGLKSASLANPERLEEVGWGVIYPEQCDSSLREALTPLLKHRRQEAGAMNPGFFREFAGPAGYQTGEDAYTFLAKHGMGPGPADPHRVPYYLLLAGDPQEIPFEFQYQLGIQYRVGRICFDLPADYGNYARAVVEAETALSRPKLATFFGPEHHDDPATSFLVTRVVRPLADSAAIENADWSLERLLSDEATKRNLQDVLSRSPCPTLLFIASHGLYFKAGHPRQLQHQGAIVCQDWPGIGAPIADFYFAAEDVPESLDLRGLTVFYFGASSAGTPAVSDFSVDLRSSATKPFISALPKRLLGKNGALGFIGHVDQVWQASLEWKTAGPQLQTFEAALRSLMSGARLGEALRHFAARYAELAAAVTSSPLVESQSWEERNIPVFDARNYILVGDPAARPRLDAS